MVEFKDLNKPCAYPVFYSEFIILPLPQPGHFICSNTSLETCVVLKFTSHDISASLSFGISSFIFLFTLDFATTSSFLTFTILEIQQYSSDMNQRRSPFPPARVTVHPSSLWTESSFSTTCSPLALPNHRRFATML